MSTHYDRLPTLEERVRASSLIVTGRVESIRPLPRTRIGEVEEEQSVARVVIDKPLRGATSAREIEVRFISARGDTKDETPLFSAGKRMALLLTSDVGKEARANTYIAYLRGAFELRADDAFMVDTESDTPKGGARKTRVTLAALREMIKGVAAEQANEARSWAKFEPALSKEPVLSPITEIPEGVAGGGPISARPETTQPARPENIGPKRH